jgi:hypothetical protein
VTPTPATVSRRDAAVAAALAGTVVVVLGYASGLGVQATPASTLITAPPAVPAAPTTPAAPLPTPAPTPEPLPAPVIAPPPVTNSYPVPEHPASPSDPTEPPPTEPTPDPELPVDKGKTCTSLLEGLPVVGPATVPLTSVLSDFLGSTPVVGSLLAPLLVADGQTGLDCLLGAGQ